MSAPARQGSCCSPFIILPTDERHVMAPIALSPNRPSDTPRASIQLTIAVCAIAACGETTPSGAEPSSQVVAPPLPTVLAIELPPGIEVALDGRARGVTPLRAWELPPGLHTLTLVADCKEVQLPLELPAHETTRIDLGQADALAFVTLEITALDLAGKPLEHTVVIDDTVLGGGNGSSTTLVSPCKHRLRVASAGLGGFIEDIDLGKQARVQRELVLSPGPDMVRVHGGPFTLGPPEAIESRWNDDDGNPIFPRVPVVVETFDLDRTEVTAAQWMACRAAGGCQRRREAWWATALPDERDLPYCNVNTMKLEAVMVDGREDHPMNCVARWEAEDYCQWAGKRLPDANEWEYATRSGNDRYLWPWGLDPYTCEHGKTVSSWETCGAADGTDPVCSHPKGNTELGVCDLIGNVEEYVQKTYSPHPSRRWEDLTCMGSGWREYDSEPFHGSPCFEHARQESNLGFRCAREATKGEVR